MENDIIVKEVDGITHYVNPKFKKVFDGTEEVSEPHSANPLFISLTEEELQQYEAIQKVLNAKRYLAESDWYVIRQMEAGTPIPEEVLLKRKQARIDINN